VQVEGENLMPRKYNFTFYYYQHFCKTSGLCQGKVHTMIKATCFAETLIIPHVYGDTINSFIHSFYCLFLQGQCTIKSNCTRSWVYVYVHSTFL